MTSTESPPLFLSFLLRRARARSLPETLSRLIFSSAEGPSSSFDPFPDEARAAPMRGSSSEQQVSKVKIFVFVFIVFGALWKM
jgi:hypothetical protein